MERVRWKRWVGVTHIGEADEIPDGISIRRSTTGGTLYLAFKFLRLAGLKVRYDLVQRRLTGAAVYIRWWVEDEIRLTNQKMWGWQRVFKINGRGYHPWQA